MVRIRDAEGVQGRRAWLGVAAAVVVTIGIFVGAVFVAGLLACGISGCSGGGFGPVFAPRQAQAGLLVAGLSLVPLTLWLLRERARRWRLVAGAAVLAGGALVAMTLIGIGPNGCPWGQTQAVAGPDAVSPGALTCSGDRDALP